MKKLVLSIMILLGCLSSVSAEPYWLQKPVQCAPPQEVVTHQAKIYQEIPFLMLYGKSLTPTGTFRDTSYILSVNMETKTWTMIEFASELKQACIVATGNDFKPAPQEKKIDIRFGP